MIFAQILNAENVALRVGGFPSRLLPELKGSILRLAFMLEAHVKQDKLSGDPLHVKTGRLRRSIHHEVRETADGIGGVVGTNVPYAAVHEYGFSGTVSVQSHLRTITQAWGKKLKGGPQQVRVQAFTRKMNMPERSFLRSALKEQSTKILTGLEATVARVLRGE